MIDVQRLLEKRFEDIKHIETERHWFLGAYAVVVAGILTFLAQNEQAGIFSFAFAALTILSFLGLLHTLRAAWIGHLINNDIRQLVKHWEKDPAVKDIKWLEEWLWPQWREQGLRELRPHFWHWLFNLLRRFWQFVSITLLFYLLSLIIFAWLFVVYLLK